MKILTKRFHKLIYAMAGIGVNMLNLMMGSYLCSALISSGFGEEVIKYQTFAQKDLVVPALWAAFGILAKIIDGVIDVPMASLTDNLKSRFGRRRPSLVIGFIPMVAAYLLFLVIPVNMPRSVLNTVYYGVMLCIFYSFYTLTMVTYYSTFTEIVDSNRARSFISNVKSVCDIVYFILGYVGVRMLLNGLNIRTVALMVLPLSLTMLIPMFMIKEPSNLSSDTEVSSVGLIGSLTCTFKNRTFILWMVVYAFMTFGVQLFLSGINEYFSKAGMSMILVMIAAFVPVPLTLIIYNRILKKKGFAMAFGYALITYTIGMLSMFATSHLAPGSAKTVVSIMCGLCCSLAVGALFAVSYAIPSELAAEEHAESGAANSAMYFAVQGLFSGVATGIGANAILTLLKTTDKVFYMTPICAAGTFISFLLLPMLPKRLKELGREMTISGNN